MPEKSRRLLCLRCQIRDQYRGSILLWITQRNKMWSKSIIAVWCTVFRDRYIDYTGEAIMWVTAYSHHYLYQLCLAWVALSHIQYCLDV